MSMISQENEAEQVPSWQMLLVPAEDLERKPRGRVIMFHASMLKRFSPYA